MIEFEQVAKSYDKIVALDIERLRVEPASLAVLVGPNGAGKSTLLTLVAGLTKPSAGSISVNSVAAGSRAAREVVTFVPDQPALFDDLTLSDQLGYLARLHKLREPTELCQEMISVLDAHELLDGLPRSMSKGQRQKASLLMGMARPFEVLLLDEPTTGLDASSRAALISALASLAEAGKTVLCSTHEIELIEAAGDRIQLSDGRLEQP